MTETTVDLPPPVALGAEPVQPAFRVLGAIGFAHLLNDLIQSLILAIYPLLKADFSLSFAQVGLITLTYQLTASLLQPLIGHLADRRPLPYSLPVGMGFTLAGLLLLAMAPNYPVLLLAAALVGSGSSVFHPESSRVARMAAGQRPGLAQSLFVVGGNLGTALGPLLAAWIVVPHGRSSVAWFSLAALLAIAVLVQIGHWYARHARARASRPRVPPAQALPSSRVWAALLILGVLIFSKYFYLASLSSYYTFYLIETFAVSVQSAQVHLFVFLAAVAAGVLIGGPLGDRIGRKWVILGSIFGVAPFTLALPHVGLLATGALTVLIGLVLSSAFTTIVVYAQELVPARIGMISGLFYGLAFGMGGIGAAVLGWLADLHGIGFVYQLCAWLPLIGALALWLPDPDRHAVHTDH
ncbi:MAG TPA: MFS transporter [Rhodanobacteraceae bacterium]|nr:MFS transporter [Rhodanobacteraceae bacterium]